jgi:hypothetical protein
MHEGSPGPQVLTPVDDTMGVSIGTDSRFSNYKQWMGPGSGWKATVDVAPGPWQPSNQERVWHGELFGVGA